MSSSTVLLTGVTGFLGSHTSIQLLEKGYKVVGTLRNLDRADSIREIIGQHTKKVENLSFAEADLKDSEVWNELCKGVHYIQHIASPFPRVLPKDDQELIKPAREGTLRILEAAVANGVKRAVITSSTGAIIYGKAKDQRGGTYTEEDWTDEKNVADATPYFRSKTIAERAAWSFAQEHPELELTTVCPGAILGPVLEKDFGTSANIVIKTMDGSSPAIPRIGFDMVDVRSVADALVRAMEVPEAAGERFIASAGYLSFIDVANILREAYPKRKIPKTLLPNFAVRLFSNIDPTIKPILNDLGVERKLDPSKTTRILGWDPIPPKEAVLACAESIFQHGIL